MGSEHLLANGQTRTYSMTKQRGGLDTPDPITGPNTETGIKLVSWSLVISIASQYKLGLGGRRENWTRYVMDPLTAMHSV